MAKYKNIPLYQQIQKDIKTAIESGKYKPDEKIPSESALSEEYSASRITIRRAVKELCNEGYLFKLQGVGTFVEKPHIHRKFTGTNELDSFTNTCLNHGMVSGAQLIDCQIVPSRKDEQDFFKISKDAMLIYIERIRTADNRPIFLENLFMPYNEYKDLLNMDLKNVSMFDTIEKIGGLRPVHADHSTLEITKASSEQARKLDISIGEPLFFFNVYMLDKDRNPICIGRQYYIGNRYMFEF